MNPKLELDSPRNKSLQAQWSLKYAHGQQRVSFTPRIRPHNKPKLNSSLIPSVSLTTLGIGTETFKKQRGSLSTIIKAQLASLLMQMDNESTTKKSGTFLVTSPSLCELSKDCRSASWLSASHMRLALRPKPFTPIPKAKYEQIKSGNANAKLTMLTRFSINAMHKSLVTATQPVCRKVAKKTEIIQIKHTFKPNNSTATLVPSKENKLTHMLNATKALQPLLKEFRIKSQKYQKPPERKKSKAAQSRKSISDLRSIKTMSVAPSKGIRIDAAVGTEENYLGDGISFVQGDKGTGIEKVKIVIPTTTPCSPEECTGRFMM